MNIGIILAALGVGAAALALKKPAVFRASLHVYGNAAMDVTNLSKALRQRSMLLVDKRRIMDKARQAPGEKEAERLATPGTRPGMLIALRPSFDSVQDGVIWVLKPFLDMALAVHRTNQSFPYTTLLAATNSPFARSAKALVDELNSRVGEPYRHHLQLVQVERDGNGAFILTPNAVAQITHWTQS